MSFGPVAGVPATGENLAAGVASAFNWAGAVPDFIRIQVKSTAPGSLFVRTNVLVWADPTKDYEYEILPGRGETLPIAGSSKDARALRIDRVMVAAAVPMLQKDHFTITGFGG